MYLLIILTTINIVEIDNILKYLEVKGQSVAKCHEEDTLDPKYQRKCLEEILSGTQKTCVAKEANQEKRIWQWEGKNIVSINAQNTTIIPSCAEQFNITGTGLLEIKYSPTINDIMFEGSIGEFNEVYT